MVEISVKSVSKLIFSHATVSFKQIRWWNTSKADQCVASIRPCSCFSSDLLKPNCQSQRSLLTPWQQFINCQQTPAVQNRHGWESQCRQRWPSDVISPPTRGFSRKPRPPLTPPTYVVLNCRSAHVTYIHISFPAPGWHFHGNRSRCWVELCVITYMSVGVHLCLHRLKPWQSPNCINAYGKVGEGLGRQEETTGKRKLNICLSLFGISWGHQAERVKCEFLDHAPVFFLGCSPWKSPRAVGGPGDVNPLRCSYVIRLRSEWAVGASQSCSGTVRKNCDSWSLTGICPVSWQWMDGSVVNSATPRTDVRVCLKGSCCGGCCQCSV